MPSGLWLPRRYVNKPIAVVFWYSEKLNRIIGGVPPEQYPIPDVLREQGYNKVVCRSTDEVKVWSDKLRDQERRDAEIEQAKREAIEGPIREALRKDLVYRRDHARNPINRAVMERALAKDDEYRRQPREQDTRITYQHCEGYEEGH